MAYHLRSIEHGCEYPACTKLASVQVYNTYNAPMGKYCKKHGSQELERFQKRHEGG